MHGPARSVDLTRPAVTLVANLLIRPLAGAGRGGVVVHASSDSVGSTWAWFRICLNRVTRARESAGR